MADARRIIVIAPEQRKRLDEYLASGFDGFLIKPVRQSSLEAMLLPAHNIEVNTVPVAEGPGSGEVGNKRSLRILLAEDNDINALLVSALLKKQGHRVDHVKDGQEAIKAAIQVAYDIVLMDVHMPEMDGLAATKEIRALDAPNGEVPILALTANVMAEDKQRCFDAGMNEFLPKPIVAEELELMLDRFANGGTAIEPGAAHAG